MADARIARLACVLALLGTLPAQATPTLAKFRNYNQTFEIELPAGWRQIAPNEAVQLREREGAPRELTLAQPRDAYAVGPVERWLAGDFSGPWLYVVEQRDPWYVDDDYATVLRDSWRERSESTGVANELAAVTREKIGTQEVECVVADRTSKPPAPSPERRSLDVHAPTASQQVTLSFSCEPDRFDRWQPRFRAWLGSLTFARVPRESASLTDRLWTPIITGAIVGIVLLLLYRHTRARR